MLNEYQIAKIREVLLYILSRFDEGLDYIKLFQILYFAQKENLVNYGKVIVDDSFHAFKHGPVPSYIYKTFQMAKVEELKSDVQQFLSTFKITDKRVFAIRKPDMDYISGSDLCSLNFSIEKYGKEESITLSKLSHDSAWTKALKLSKNDPQKDLMTIIDIARAGKATEATLAFIRQKERFRNEFSLWTTY